MKRLLIGIILVGIVSSAALSAAAGNDEQELMALEQEAWKAVAKLDYGAIDRILADDFIGIYGDTQGDLWTKGFLVTSLKSGKFVLTSIEYDNLSVRIHGRAATVSGGVTTKETFAGKDVGGRFQFTSTWIKGPAGWRCTGDRSVRIADAAAEQELSQLQQEWSRAEVAGDVRAVDRLLADEYVLTTSDGTTLPKAQYLHDVESEDTRVTAMTIKTTKVRLYGDIALVKGVTKWTEPNGKKHEERFTEPWLKRNGRWQCLITLSTPVKDTTPVSQKLSPEMKKLAVFVGEWIYEGEQMEPPVEGLPFGEAGAFSGKSTARFVLDGAFQERRFKDDAPLTAGGIGLLGYDPKKQCYVNHGYVNDGSQSISTARLDGHIWKIDSVTTTSKGDKVPVRYIEEYSSDWSSFTGTVEASPDNGKTWKLWWKERGKKVK